MKEGQTKLGICILVVRGSEIGQRDGPHPVVRHELNDLVRQFLIYGNLPIPRQQAEISQQRSMQKFPFCQDVIFPTLLPCIRSGDSQFSLDNRSSHL